MRQDRVAKRGVWQLREHGCLRDRHDLASFCSEGSESKDLVTFSTDERLQEPALSESVCVRRTLAIGILVSRYGMACFWASDSFTPTRANSGSVNMQNGISRPETRERDHNRHQSNKEDRPRNS